MILNNLIRIIQQLQTSFMKKTLFVLAISMVCILCYGQDTNSELLKKLVEKNILTQDEADEIGIESTKCSRENSLENTRSFQYP